MKELDKITFEISRTSCISKLKSPKRAERFTLLIIRKYLLGSTVSFDLDACITKGVSDFILIRSHTYIQASQMQRPNNVGGHLLPLTYMLRRICALYAWSGQDNGTAVARK